jgi:hypothetical protein
MQQWQILTLTKHQPNPAFFVKIIILSYFTMLITVIKLILEGMRNWIIARREISLTFRIGSLDELA